MKNFKATLAASLFIVFSPLTYSQTFVDVLVMAEPGADITEIPVQLAAIQSVMNGSGTGITFNYAYGGVPKPIPNMTGSDTVQHLAATAWPNLNFERNYVAADIVLVFVDDLSGCGFAPQDNWSGGGGMSPTGGPDYSGDDDYFVGLISTGTAINELQLPIDCRDNDNLAAHEVGHLFGAGHEDVPPGQYDWLYGDSHADYTKPIGVNGSYTVMTQFAPPALCISASCAVLGKFSDTLTNSTGASSTDYNNKRAINATKVSVAGYRTPGCSLIDPDPVFGSINNPCDPDPWTSHNVAWHDSCEDASDRYEVHAQQPATLPWDDSSYVYKWTVFSTPWDEIFVKGGTANIKIKSCNSSFCSDKSDTWYQAQAICEGH